MPNHYFKVANLFGEAGRSRVGVAEAGARGVGRSARAAVKARERDALLDTLFNLTILGMEFHKDFKRSARIDRFAESIGFDKISSEPSEGVFENLFSSPTFTRRGQELSGADIDVRRLIGDR